MNDVPRTDREGSRTSVRAYPPLDVAQQRSSPVHGDSAVERCQRARATAEIGGRGVPRPDFDFPLDPLDDAHDPAGGREPGVIVHA